METERREILKSLGEVFADRAEDGTYFYTSETAEMLRSCTRWRDPEKRRLVEEMIEAYGLEARDGDSASSAGGR